MVRAFRQTLAIYKQFPDMPRTRRMLITTTTYTNEGCPKAIDENCAKSGRFLCLIDSAGLLAIKA
jgi:hypothetical protein